MLKIYITSHRGYEIYLTTTLDTFECPRLTLFGYATDTALIRAINRTLSSKKRKTA